MKTPKLTTAIVAIFLFSNLLFAGNPKTQDCYLIEKLSKDIIITDSQKLIIQAKAVKFETLLKNTTSMKDDQTLKQAFVEYKALVDSILTSDQKMQLEKKHNERKNAAMNEFKNKK